MTVTIMQRLPYLTITKRMFQGSQSNPCSAWPPAPSLNIEVKIFNFSATMYEDEQCMANNKYALYLLF